MSRIDPDHLRSRIDILPTGARKSGTLFKMKLNGDVKEARGFQDAFERKGRNVGESAGAETPSEPDNVNIYAWPHLMASDFLPELNDIFYIDGESYLIQKIDFQMMNTRWVCQCTGTTLPAEALPQDPLPPIDPLPPGP